MHVIESPPSCTLAIALTSVVAYSLHFQMMQGAAMAKGLVATSPVGVRTSSLGIHLGSSRLPLGLRPPQVLERRRRERSLQSRRKSMASRQGVIVRALLPADPWAPGNAVDSQSIASSLFAASLFPYLGFLYHLSKSKTAPPLTLFGFYFLLAFVAATIPAGIYAKLHYGTSLSNVDWLHGGAESLLTLTNLFIVFGLRGALRNAKEESSEVEVEQEEKLPLSK